MKNFALISLLGTCFVACSGSDPAAAGPATEVADGGDEPKRDTTVTTDPSCPKKSDVDELDANGTDDNCDGIDGVLSDTVFVVAGAPETGKGIPADPVGSIAKGAELAKAAGKHHVYVCIGTFTETAEIVAPADLHVHGGFACDRNWRRIGTDPRTTWATASPEALRITGGTKVSFDHFDITAGNAVEAGDSSVAVALNGVADVVLSDVLLVAGNGANGVAGANGAPRLPARGPSANGNFADFPGYAALAVQQDCTLPGGPTNHAGSGGEAAARVRRAGDSGGNSTEGTDGGDWRYVGSGVPTLSSAYAAGSAGADGQAGASASAVTSLLGTIVEARYVPSIGAAGAPGTNGRSGGGGAPGHGVEVCYGYVGGGGGIQTWICHGPDPRAFVTRGGGGGGAGGCYGAGGGAGAGGQSGGASIALLASGSTLKLENAILRSATGGAGGASGQGTPGQLGGAPGQGGAASRWEQANPEIGPANSFAGAGFPGGKGGNGGQGGHGAPGAGGPSVGLYVVGTAPVVDATVRFEPGAGGGGGAGAAGVQAGPTGRSEQQVLQ